MTGSVGSREWVVAVLVDDPTTDQVHQPYSAFNQGFDAYEKYQLPATCNPYTAGSGEHTWWQNGWAEAQEQYGY